MLPLSPLRLEPDYHERVWGGNRLKPGGSPVGEAWVVHGANRISGGPFAGSTLAELTARHGPDLLGTTALDRFGSAFPLVIKLIDTTDWLSIQVHPDDAQAVALEGAGMRGKTEAWHILETEPGGDLIAGLTTRSTAKELETMVRDGSIMDHLRHHPVQPGDTLFVPAGTLHALGPGLFIYEVQQASDITYRVFDWNRPASAGRALHIEQSLAVVDPASEAAPASLPSLEPDAWQSLVASPFFQLETIRLNETPSQNDTGGETFHALTSAAGTLTVAGEGWREEIAPYQSLLILASAGAYAMHSADRGRALRASIC
jgi:mannose-6-phosphate isomerase